ncbi:MAG: arabinofuranosyltransferase, partial [Actinomycetes bacterium]
MTALWALATWLYTAPLAIVAVRAIDTNPSTDRAAIMPIALAMLIAIAVAVVAVVLRRRAVEASRSRCIVCGVSAGLLGAWTAFTTAGALVGTPYGYAGLQGDVVRLTALATRYMSSWGSTDQFVGNLPAEYPPLFPWLTGHLASLTGRQAWALVGDMEVLTLSLGLVLAYVFWSRVLPAIPALLITALGIAEFADPRKSYEVVALWLFVPWVLSYLTPRALERRRSWLAGGVIAGLLILLYQGYFLFALLGLVVLALQPLWRADRASRLRWAKHVLATGLVAFVIASWFLVPYLWTTLTSGSQRTYDYFVSPGGLRSDPLGTSILTDGGWVAVVHWVGLLGLALLWRRSLWSRTLGVLFLGTLLYRSAYLTIFVLTGHTGLLHYATR